VFGLDDDFIGPAAIALAHRYNLDSRDQGRAERRAIIGVEWGAWDCTFVGECSVACPKHVDPAVAIQRTKLDLATTTLKSVLWPFGSRP
jgi:fumarate reductase iron-sulfur subunit